MRILEKFVILWHLHSSKLRLSGNEKSPVEAGDNIKLKRQSLVPVVQLAYLRAYLFKLVLRFDTAARVEVQSAGLVLVYPLGSECAVLNLGEDFLHLLLGFLGDKALARFVIAELRGV